MQRDKESAGRLVIHSAKPETIVPEASAPEPPARRRIAKLKRRGAKVRPAASRLGEKKKRPGITAGERLLRDTAIACALLMCVMAVRNVNQPWSEKATDGVKQAMTMRIDLDETLGRLKFVRALIPETALVFMNLGGGGGDLATPVNGSIVHSYDTAQPWTEYQCGGNEPVYSAADGTVETVGQGAVGDYIVSITHADGRQSVYAYLESVDVAPGDTVTQGQQIGLTAAEESSRMYFEVRGADGSSIDPGEMTSISR